MDTSMPDADSAPSAGEGDTEGRRSQEQTLAAPPSDSTGLSSAPPTDSRSARSDTIVVAPSSSGTIENTVDTNGIHKTQDTAADRTDQDLARADVSLEPTPPPGALPQQAEHTATPSHFAIPAVPASGSVNSTPRDRGGARGGRWRGTMATNGDATGKTADGTTVPGRGRGRGRGGGRPRGSGKRKGGRGGKRKRGDDDDEDDESGNTDSSDEITPIATETRSGRSIQKPTNFAPPPPSPTTNKRKRAYNYRNPQAAVCKICLRGTSPASNPVVFCDGCNAPYHRWCHKPFIDQAVIDKEDAEWYCQRCAASRVVPIRMTEVADFVSVTGASEDQRRKYFASLPQGVLVTLLTKATTFRPDLPLFDSRFKELVANPQSNGNGEVASTSSVGNGKAPAVPSTSATNGQGPSADDAAYTDDVHPENYPRPGKGLMSTLPPETEDLEWLVDDDDKHGVFTHLYHEPSKAQPAAPPPTMSTAPPVTAPSTSSTGTSGTTASAAIGAQSNDNRLA